MPGAPVIYFGDEIGMEGGNDPDCRRCMQWHPPRWKIGLQDHIQKLIRLRRSSPALRRGQLRVIYSDDRILAYERTYSSNRVLVVLNNSRAARDVCIPLPNVDSGTLTDEISGDTLVVKEGALNVAALVPRPAFVCTLSHC